MGLTHQSTCGKDFTVKHLLYAVCNVRNVFKEKVRPKIGEDKDEEKEKKQEKSRFDGIKKLA